MSDLQLIDIHDNGKILKRIITEGDLNNERYPESGNIVSVLYKGRLKENNEEFDSNMNKENPFSFTIDEDGIILGWSIALKTMKLNEVAEFHISHEYAYGDAGSPPKIPEKATLIFEITLLDIKEKEKTKYDYPEEDRLKMANEFKAEADKNLLKKEYDSAIDLYEKCLDFIDFEKDDSVPKLKVSCYLNLSLIYLNKNEYNKVIEKCNNALEFDNSNIKALYRMGIANTKLQQYEKAINNLKYALKVEPNNKDIQLQLKNTVEEFKKYKTKEKDMMAKMFSKDIYTSKATINPNIDIDKLPESDIIKVFFDISINDAVKKIEFNLFKNIAPKTVENFKCLVTGEKGDNLCFKNSIFHRLIKGFMIQGGDITNGDGTGGKSIYGEYFDDEAFTLKHTRRGLLSMANKGKNTNGSQFFITFKPADWLDGKHIVFGSVSKNIELLDELEEIETNGDKPTSDIKIVDCGLVN